MRLFLFSAKLPNFSLKNLRLRRNSCFTPWLCPLEALDQTLCPDLRHTVGLHRDTGCPDKAACPTPGEDGTDSRVGGPQEQEDCSLMGALGRVRVHTGVGRRRSWSFWGFISPPPASGPEFWAPKTSPKRTSGILTTNRTTQGSHFRLQKPSFFPN